MRSSSVGGKPTCQRLLERCTDRFMCQELDAAKSMLLRPGKVGEVVVRPFGKGVRSVSLERQGGELSAEPSRVIMPQSKINEVADRLRARGAHSLMARRTFSFHHTDESHAQQSRRPSAVLQQHQPTSSAAATRPAGTLADRPPPAPIAAVVLDMLPAASAPDVAIGRPPPLPRLNFDGMRQASAFPPAGQLAPPGSTPPPSRRGDDSTRSMTSAPPLPTLGPMPSPLPAREPCSDRSSSRQRTPRFPASTTSSPEGSMVGGALTGSGSSARGVARSILRSPSSDRPSPQKKKVSFTKDCKPAPPASISDLLSFCAASA